MVAYCGRADLGGMSGDEARVVPDHNEGTGEDGDVKLGKGSHSSIAIDGIEPLPAENAPRSRSLGVKAIGIVVSRLRWVDGCCQSKEVGVVTIMF